MLTKKVLAGLIVSVALSVGVYKYFSHATAPEPAGVWVQASTVKEVVLPLEIRVLGTLVAPLSVEIKPDVAEHVEKIYFKDGTEVPQGATLVQLDDAEYQAKYKAAKAKLIYSEGDFKRLSVLAKKQFLSRRDIDKAEADLKQNRADLQQIENMLNKMKLTAPFDGVVGKSNVTAGDYVTVGETIVELTDTKHLRVEYNVHEKYLPSLKLGQEVTVTASAYPNKVFKGKVAFISPTINVNNRSVALYADVLNAENLLAPGMFVNIVQRVGNAERAIVIPSRSLVPVLDGEQVYKIKDGKAYATDVVVGQRMQDSVEITQGLVPGDQVVTDGQLKLKNGIPVKVKT